ncbi:hypothetical protein [Secundilactobacillus kimchicus]|uniref:hypothetical protein n=1 Tax=Secundilactobacillus kimchicus TaxID=528209 RepID=UPI0006D0AA3E|nr:hypothetical protein [Secundilactobacillus kimchicus]
MFTKKDDLTKPIATGSDLEGTAITGLSSGDVVADGDYKASHVDPDGKLDESDKVDVPGFTVIKSKAVAPTKLTVTPTADGAVIKPS